MKSKLHGVKDRGPQGFSLDLGSWLNPSGERKYRRHWLGQDKRGAEAVARVIVALWAVVKASGGDTWTADDLARIETAKKAMKSLRSPTPPATASKAETSTNGKPVVMLYDAADAYLASVAVEVKSRQITGSHAITQTSGMTAMKQYMADVPVNSIGFNEIRSMVGHFLSRPVSPHTLRKFSVAHVITILTAMKRFFQHLADSGQWAGGPALDKGFKFSRSKLSTDAELEEQSTVKVFTLAELTTLWKTFKTDRQRLYFLLGINCGFTQMEIATLRRPHCYLDAKSKLGTPIPYIKRSRNKTKVKGKWRLWPETAELLRKEMNMKASDDTALLSEQGNPLVSYPEGGYRHDSIKLHWAKILAFCNTKVILEPTVMGRSKSVRVPIEPQPVLPLGFKYLRKTSSDMIRKIDGKDAAETFLCHADMTLAKVYNNRDFKRLSKAIRKMRSRLAPMFDAVKPDTFKGEGLSVYAASNQRLKKTA